MGLDSVDLIVRLEKHFAILIPDREAEQIVTVQQLCDTVWRQVAGPPELEAEVRQWVIDILSDHTGTDASHILPGQSLTADLGLD